jgi:hypothetical protein
VYTSPLGPLEIRTRPWSVRAIGPTALLHYSCRPGNRLTQTITHNPIMTHPFTLIDTVTGTYLDPTSCVLVPDEAATPLWLGDETDLSDSEIGGDSGISVPATFDLAQCIADALWGRGCRQGVERRHPRRYRRCDPDPAPRPSKGLNQGRGYPRPHPLYSSMWPFANLDKPALLSPQSGNISIRPKIEQLVTSPYSLCFQDSLLEPGSLPKLT